MSPQSGPPKLVYFRGEIVPFDEDILHEFKGHRIMTVHDVKPDHNTDERRKARQYWSKYACGFLNTGLGGILYGGITDDGAVKGFTLSKYQRLHVALAVGDMFDNFKPAVEDEAWDIQFVPVVEMGATTYQKDLTVVDEGLWTREHRLRDFRSCWCDDMARRGGKNPSYVVEVRMKPWVEVGGEKELPSFMAEDGQHYMRKCGITDMYTEEMMNQLRTEQRRERRMMERMRRDGLVAEGNGRKTELEYKGEGNGRKTDLEYKGEGNGRKTDLEDNTRVVGLEEAGLEEAAPRVDGGGHHLEKGFMEAEQVDEEVKEEDDNNDAYSCSIA